MDISKIDNTSLTGLKNLTSTSSINNDGIIEIGTIGALLNIGNAGVFNEGTFMNSANLIINATTGGGIHNHGAFSNASMAIINIDASAWHAIVNQDIGAPTTFENMGQILLGSFSTIGFSGLYNKDASFTNHQNALLQIDNTTQNGIHNESGTYILTNDGDIKIGSIGPAMNIGRDGIENNGTLTNNTNGLIQIDNTIYDGIWNRSSGSMTNDGEIKIGGIGSGSIDWNGIENNGTITNNTDGLIQIDNTTSGSDGIFNSGTSASITNDGDIVIGSSGIGSIGAEGFR